MTEHDVKRAVAVFEEATGAKVPTPRRLRDRSQPQTASKHEPSQASGFTQPGNNGSQENEPWPDPKSLEALLLPVPSMSVEMLPEQLRGWLSDLADRMQCPLDLLAPAAITMLGSLVGTACRIRPKSNDNWEEVPNFYGGTVSPPGTMKTPAMSAVFKMIDKLEAASRQIHEEEMKGYSLEKAKYEARRKWLLGRLDKLQASTSRVPNHGEREENQEEIEEELRNLSEPKPPVWKRFKTNNATVEKLHEIIVENPRGAFSVADELSGLISQWDSTGHETDRAFFLQGYNGKGPYAIDRIIRGTVYVPDLCISLFGGIQPIPLVPK